MMINVYFMRKDRRQKRGYIADVPTNAKCDYVDPFIIVQVDESVLTVEKEVVRNIFDMETMEITGQETVTVIVPNEELLTDSTVRLDLENLMIQYPNTEEPYTDEDGNNQTRTIYGYFHTEGTSVVEGCPVITLDDILRGEVVDV